MKPIILQKFSQTSSVFQAKSLDQKQTSKPKLFLDPSAAPAFKSLDPFFRYEITDEEFHHSKQLNKNIMKFNKTCVLIRKRLRLELRFRHYVSILGFIQFSPAMDIIETHNRLKLVFEQVKSLYKPSEELPGLKMKFRIKLKIIIDRLLRHLFELLSSHTLDPIKITLASENSQFPCVLPPLRSPRFLLS